MSTKKEEVNILIDIEKMRREIRHDLAQEYNWESQQKHWESQKTHRDRQLYYWIGTVVLTASALIASPFIIAYASRYFN